jgi:CTP:molybdopterin cytidylyltransferase MocA
MIVIPMAGLSRRFAQAGYAVPKYMLSAHGKPMFAHSVTSFAAYFRSEPFLFIVRDVAGTPDFVRQQCNILGIADARIIVVDAPTGGQAETVALGLQQASVEAAAPVTVFNIDTLRPGFRHADFNGAPTDGYLEVFRGGGDNWSYVRPAGPNIEIVMDTTEKRAIYAL